MAVAIEPLVGRWPYQGLPAMINVARGAFARSSSWSPHPLVVAHYRELRPTNSRHLVVLRSGLFVVAHRDAFNPHAHPLAHFLRDVLFEPVPTV